MEQLTRLLAAAELLRRLASMDLTDVTITPMIPVGIGAATALIKGFTGWSLGISLLAGVIPGAVAGFIGGVGLFIAVSLFTQKLSERKSHDKNSG